MRDDVEQRASSPWPLYTSLPSGEVRIFVHRASRKSSATRSSSDILCSRVHDATYDPRVSAGSSPSTNACKMSRQDKNPWKCAFFSSSTGAERMPCLASAAIASPTVAVQDTVTTVDGGRVSRNRRSDHPNSRRRAGSRSGGVNVVSAVVAVFRALRWFSSRTPSSASRVTSASDMSTSPRLPRRMSPIARSPRGMPRGVRCGSSRSVVAFSWLSRASARPRRLKKTLHRIVMYHMPQRSAASCL